MPFADAGGIRIHYEIEGRGEPLVLIAGTSFDMSFWEPMLPALTGFRILRIDNRGSGLSEAPDERYSIRRMADDVAAVMAEAGVESAHVYGSSMGSLIAQELAIRHPERVLSLILGAASVGAPLFPPSLRLLPLLLGRLTPEEAFRKLHRYLTHESREVEERFPGHALAERSPIGLRRQVRAQLRYSSLPRLRRIQRPALVLHGERDQLIPPVNARLLARLLPRGRLQLVRGAGHLYHRDRPRETERALLEFLLEAASEILDERDFGIPPRSTDTMKRSSAVLFTDIVESTAHLARLGDEPWSGVLARHDDLSRAAVKRHGGTFVRTTGDGAVALFDNAAAGVACARDILGEVRSLGIEARAGVHVGEYLATGTDICGLAVHVAARIAGCAGPGEVLVSEAARNSLGSGASAFAACGVELLKGVPGEWRLYAPAGSVTPEQA